MPIKPHTRLHVPIDKLRGYSLSVAHKTGQHKAVVFQAALGATASDAEIIADLIYAQASSRLLEMQKRPTNDFGEPYELVMTLKLRGRSATVLTGWIILFGDNVLYLTTCYVLGGR